MILSAEDIVPDHKSVKTDNRNRLKFRNSGILNRKKGIPIIKMTD